jgi:uncharacterized protein (TIGR02246 family)
LVTATVRDFVSAWNRHDTNALAGLFAPDGVFESPRGATAQGREQIVDLLTEEHRKIYRGTTLHATVKEVTFPSDGVALAEGSYTLSGIDVALGFEVSAEGSFDYRMTRGKESWSITRARIHKQ